MQTRREFCWGAASAAALGMMPKSAAAERLVRAAGTEPYRTDRPMLELQQKFLDLRLGMFLHFNMATFQDREWGDPRGPMDAFAPTAIDADQWADAAVAAGMGYGCLTTKHHDGFAIWPTKTGGDSILHSPGQPDVVRAYVDAFRKRGLRVGLYYSILDLRHDIRHFNVTPAKIEFIKAQLTELLTQYGPIDLMIFDGWDAPWSRISYREVPFHEIYALIKKLQPNCLISELNASQYPPSALYYSDIKAFEQNAGQMLPAESLVPAQSCVTLTDGWFWKTGDEDRPLKSAKQVVEEWLVPQNARHCNLIVNAPPNRDGKLAPNVVERLHEIGALWKERGPAPKVRAAHIITTDNIAEGRPIRASFSPDTYGPDMVNDGKFSNSWYMAEGETEAWLEVDLPRGAAFNRLVLAEPVGRWDDYASSRIAHYRFEALVGKTWKTLVEGESREPVRIEAVPRTQASKVRLTIRAAADTPHVAELGVYDEPSGN